MTAFLLFLFLAQPGPDDCSRFEQKLAEQLGEAGRLMEDDPEEALRLLNAVLADPEARKLEARFLTVRQIREGAFYLRGRIQLDQGQAQAVITGMTALLKGKRARYGSQVAGLVGTLASRVPCASLSAYLVFPLEAPLGRVDFHPALALRADAYKQLGQHDKEAADRAEAMEIGRWLMLSQDMKWNLPPNPPGQSMPWHLAINPALVSWLAGWLSLVAVFGGMVPVFFVMGLRQRREACGTWRRLFWVSLLLAALQTVPLLAAFLLLRWRPAFHWTGLYPITLLVFVINVLRHRSYLGAVKWVHGREAPPLLKDAEVLNRIVQIAASMRIAPPVTRLVRSAVALQTNNALIGGLVAPTMVVFDGLLNRLTEEERDAIIAHELAHLANHTFFCRLFTGAACSIAVVTASVFYPPLVALGLGLALLVGSWLFLSRLLELDCDRRAARAIGHRRAASALAKIHADQPFHGLLEFLIGAVSTHPSRDERLAAIYRVAPDDDRPAVEWDCRLLRQRRLASWGAAGLWLAVIVASLVWGYYSPQSSWPALPLVLLEVLLFVLVFLGARKTLRRQRRLQRTRPNYLGRLSGLVLALVAVFSIAYLCRLTQPYVSHGASVAILVSGLLTSLVLGLMGSRNRANKLNHQIIIAIQSGDFPRALALAEGSPAVVAGSTELRYNHALLQAILGQRAEALAELAQLRRDDPGFKMTLALEVNLYADQGDCARALESAVQLSHDLPGEPIGPQAEAWLLRKLGRLEEAESRARQALKMDPRVGQAHLTLAAVALDRGDLAAAREQLAQAERLVPGSVTAALLAAEVALASDDPNAEAVVHQAIKAAKNNPLAFAENEVAALTKRLEARHQASEVIANQEANDRTDTQGVALGSDSRLVPGEITPPSSAHVMVLPAAAQDLQQDRSHQDQSQAQENNRR